MAMSALNQIWPEWKIERQIGRSTYSSVYQAVCKAPGGERRTAIKVISIPFWPTGEEPVRPENSSTAKTAIPEPIHACVLELQKWEKLNGIENIVGIEDYEVMENPDRTGWNFYIRMELLTPLIAYVRNRRMTEAEIIKLGCDICSALESCAECGMIHGAIKPTNIFVDQSGNFKLGDIGVARSVLHVMDSTSPKEPGNYTAPEMLSDSQYDARADLYSLGILLYRLLNENRLPFLNSAQQSMDPAEQKVALERRLRGERLPAPCRASAKTASVILRACAFGREYRFRSATEMKQALLQAESKLSPPENTAVPRQAAPYANVAPDRPVRAAEYQNPVQQNSASYMEPKKKRWPIIVGAVCAGVLLIVACIFAVPKLLSKESGSADQESNTTDVLQENQTGNNASENDLDVELPTEEENERDEQPEQAEQTERTEQIEQTISQAEELAAAGDYENALIRIRNGLLNYPDSEELQKKEEEYTNAKNEQVKETTLRQAGEYAASGDYLMAMELLEQAQQTYGNDPDYQRAYEQYEQQQTLQEQSQQYLLPDSDSRYLTEQDLQELTWEELCLARNEIYARHGRLFDTQEIADYFASKDWYHGTVRPSDFNISVLNSMELENIKLISDYEKAHYGGSYY